MREELGKVVREELGKVVREGDWEDGEELAVLGEIAGVYVGNNV